MRVLIVSSLFPPDIIGGAEIAAAHLAKWLAKKGHEVSVFTTAKTSSEACWGKEKDGLKIWKIFMPRPYPMFQHINVRFHQKIQWHLQDHFDPFNRKTFQKILVEAKPDIINLHNIQGIGYNIFPAIAEGNFPVVFTLHDFGLACIKTTMFKNEKICRKRNLFCCVSSCLKWRSLNKIKRFSFWAPSESALQGLEKIIPIRTRMCKVIKHPMFFTPPTTQKTTADCLRLLYVGRLHHSKGVLFLLECLKKLSLKYHFQITVVGGGPLEEKLKEQFFQENWCAFTGYIPSAEVGNHMINADVLCVPSLLSETLGLGAYQALSLGMPVFASNTGGLSELVENRKNGLLLPPGDSSAWTSALENLLTNPEFLLSLKQYTQNTRDRFDQDLQGNQVLDLFHATIQASS